MLACIVKNNVITNVVEVPSDANLRMLGVLPLPEGTWIGDTYSDVKGADVWDEMAAAYKEGVQEV